MCIKGYVLIVVVVICGQLGWVMSWTLFEQMETKYTSALSINTGQHTHTIPKIAKEIRLPDCLWENGFIWRAVKNCSGPSAAVPCDQHSPPRPWLSSWSRSLWSSCIEMAEKEKTLQGSTRWLEQQAESLGLQCRVEEAVKGKPTVVITRWLSWF